MTTARLLGALAIATISAVTGINGLILDSHSLGITGVITCLIASAVLITAPSH